MPTVTILASLTVFAIVSAAPSVRAGCAVPFRAPAIPLITTDPFMQTWLMGDNSTADTVRHWDGAKKEMLGMVRIDGNTYRFLGACASNNKPNGATGAYQQGTDCGGADLAPCGPLGCKMPSGSTHLDCMSKCNATEGCSGYVWDDSGCDSNSKASSVCWLKSNGCNIMQKKCRNYQYMAPSSDFTCPPALDQLSVSINPTSTVFELELAGKLSLNLTFMSTMFTDDYLRLSRPVYYIMHDLTSLDGASHSVQLYFDASAEHALNKPDQSATWEEWTEAGLNGVQIGNAVQNTVGSKGDRVNIDWGYLHMATPTCSGSKCPALRSGSLSLQRNAFVSTGLPATSVDRRMPRMISDDLPGLSQVSAFQIAPGSPVRSVVLLAYNDVDSVLYFGTKFKGFWTQTYQSIGAAMSAALNEINDMEAKGHAHDASLVANLTAKAGDKYACVCQLAYRQTLAATKLVWNSEDKVMWNFLKEISTNGDMQTMDVIYPASPMFLHTNPELLKLLLIPVLEYADNKTVNKFGNPYSPHQLGTYPIADATTKSQEPMPLENSGNMLFMILGLIEQDPNHDTSFLQPDYFNILKSWSDELIVSLPYPANQICTDDFTGPLKNNSNLGAKGIIALEAFAQLCRYSKSTTVNCSKYSAIAIDYAAVWMKYSSVSDPTPHAKISYNFPDDSWSLKYNLLWQKLLKLSGPFPLDSIISQEIAFYKSKMNKYGVPLDLRHNYVKTDWLSWAAALANTDADFHAIMDPIFAFANETPTRVPFTDLYDTSTAAAASGAFIARPVMGGLFAKMLV